MFTWERFFAGLFFFLLIITGLELGYVFYYLPNHPQTNLVIPTPILLTTVTPTPMTSYDEKSALVDGSQIKKIINDMSKNKIGFVPHLDEINFLINPKIASKQAEFQVTNSSNYWQSQANDQSPTLFSNLILLKVVFGSKKGPAGIVLSGYNGPDIKTHNIFFGTGDNGQKLYVYVKDGSQTPKVICDVKLTNRIDGLYILFDRRGGAFLVTDLSFKKILNSSPKEGASTDIPNILFPNGYMNFGYSVGPNSDLSITDLSTLLVQ